MLICLQNTSSRACESWARFSSWPVWKLCFAASQYRQEQTRWVSEGSKYKEARNQGQGSRSRELLVLFFQRCTRHHSRQKYFGNTYTNLNVYVLATSIRVSYKLGNNFTLYLFELVAHLNITSLSVSIVCNLRLWQAELACTACVAYSWKEIVN